MRPDCTHYPARRSIIHRGSADLATARHVSGRFFRLTNRASRLACGVGYCPKRIGLSPSDCRPPTCRASDLRKQRTCRRHTSPWVLYNISMTILVFATPRIQPCWHSPRTRACHRLKDELSRQIAPPRIQLFRSVTVHLSNRRHLVRHKLIS